MRGEFPDHCVLAGVPARVVRTYTPGEGWHRPRHPGSPVPPGLENVPLPPGVLEELTRR